MRPRQVLVRLAELATGLENGRDALHAGLLALKEGLGAEEAFMIYAESADFACFSSGDELRLNRTALWVANSALTTASRPQMFMQHAGRLVNFEPLAPDTPADWAAALLPARRTSADMVLVHGPWPAGIPDDACTLLSSARPSLVMLLQRFLDQRELDHDRDQFDALVSISGAATTSEDLESVLSQIAKMIGGLTGFDYVTVDIVDEHGAVTLRCGNYEVPASLREQDAWRQALSSPDPVREHVLTSREPSVFEDAQGDERLPTESRQFFMRTLIRSAVMLPITVGTDVLGVVSLASLRPRQFGQEDMKFLGGLAMQVGTSVKGMQLYRDLRASEERFRMLSSASPIGIFETDRDGKCIYVNSKILQIFGLPEEQTRGYGWMQAIHPDDRGAITEAVKKAVKDEDPFASDYRVLGPDDEVRWVNARATPLRSSTGETRGFVGTVQDISERKRFESQLVHLANHDTVTNLFNRRRLDEELERLLAESRRYGTEGALLLLDIDQFKDVNDSRGHIAGDELLAKLANVLRGRMRDTDIVARLGGDEFAIILPRANAQEAGTLADELLQMIQAYAFVVAGVPLRITVSIGIASFPAHGDTAGELLSRADVAMYQAKERGRNQTCVFALDANWEGAIETRLDWYNRVRDALEHRRFRLLAQPILDLSTGRVSRYELLLRMVEDHGQLILPGAFLGVAERMGLIKEIDRWVVCETIRLLAEHRVAGGDVRFEANLSGKAFSDKELPWIIRDELSARDVDPHALVLEVTETAAIANLSEAQRFLDSLKRIGCEFALDDFGVGFSSFYYLKHLPVDYLKIDGSFIRDLSRSTVDQHMVRAVVGLAKGLGKRTIAEYVNDKETLDLLREYGVDYAQGFHIGKPQPLPTIQPDLSVAA